MTSTLTSFRQAHLRALKNCALIHLYSSNTTDVIEHLVMTATHHSNTAVTTNQNRCTVVFQEDFGLDTENLEWKKNWNAQHV